jgi:hypothetical protein
VQQRIAFLDQLFPVQKRFEGVEDEMKSSKQELKRRLSSDDPTADEHHDNNVDVFPDFVDDIDHLREIIGTDRSIDNFSDIMRDETAKTSDFNPFNEEQSNQIIPVSQRSVEMPEAGHQGSSAPGVVHVTFHGNDPVNDGYDTEMSTDNDIFHNVIALDAELVPNDTTQIEVEQTIVHSNSVVDIQVLDEGLLSRINGNESKEVGGNHLEGKSCYFKTGAVLVATIVTVLLVVTLGVIPNLDRTNRNSQQQSSNIANSTRASPNTQITYHAFIMDVGTICVNVCETISVRIQCGHFDGSNGTDAIRLEGASDFVSCQTAQPNTLDCAVPIMNQTRIITFFSCDTQDNQDNSSVARVQTDPVTLMSCEDDGVMSLMLLRFCGNLGLDPAFWTLQSSTNRSESCPHQTLLQKENWSFCQTQLSCSSENKTLQNALGMQTFNVYDYGNNPSCENPGELDDYRLNLPLWWKLIATIWNAMTS